MSTTKAPVVRPEITGGTHRSLPLSLIATASVAVVPTFFAFAVLVFSQPEPKILAAVLLSIVLTAGAVVAGSAIWAQQPESAGVSFGDLMLWSWIRQYQAERTLQDATATLGFDRFGNFLGHSTASERAQIRAMRDIAKALDAKSTYTLGHSTRVAKHAGRMADELKLSEDRTRALVLAAELHDVGNIALPDDILRKAGNLTIEERSEMEAHVLLGARMVEKAGSSDVVDGIRYHHERWDGDGYPEHLRGHQIPGFARIIAIAEAYDAMTSTRPYRQSLSKQHAIEVLRSESGAQFDGEFVEIFISTLRKPLALVDRFPFLAALQRQFRELFLVFKRVGAVAVSATASTIAIALLLGSTVLSPGTPDDAFPELAERQRSVQPIDRVLDERITAAPEDAVDAVADAVLGADDRSSDEVLGMRFREEVRVASLEGPEVAVGGGNDDTSPDGGGNGGGATGPSGDGGTTPPGGGVDNGSGGGTGGTTSPGGSGGNGPKEGADKNPDRPGNGHGKDNAPGHDENGPGNSESAPGHNKEESDDTPGKSGSAPGHNKEESDDAPGKSGTAPGQLKQVATPPPADTETAPADSDDTPADSDDTPAESA